MAGRGTDDQAGDVAAAAGELYGLPLGEFTAARAERAKQAFERIRELRLLRHAGRIVRRFQFAAAIRPRMVTLRSLGWRELPRPAAAASAVPRP